MGFWGDVGDQFKSAGSDAWDATGGNIGKYGKKAWNWYNDQTDRDPDGYRDKLGGVGDDASRFGQQSQGQFRQLGAEATQERDYMRRIARGDESVSQMQLAQALRQNQAQQQSMAAGARPGNAAMAAQNAAANAGRQGAGLAGQQAIAGIQERHAAQQALAQMLMQQRQQELIGTQTGFNAANNAYGAAYTGSMNTPTGMEKGLKLGEDLGKYAMMAFSDKRLKKNIEGGDADADKLLRALKSYKYDYNDEKHGKGKQIGIMAQDLEKALPQAVIDTPEGKMVNGAKLATALASMMPGVNKRLEDLEKGSRK